MSCKEVSILMFLRISQTGKSTLLLQLTSSVKNAVYVSAEESLEHGAEVEIGQFALSEVTP